MTEVGLWAARTARGEPGKQGSATVKLFIALRLGGAGLCGFLWHGACGSTSNRPQRRGRTRMLPAEARPAACRRLV